jgi:hypothetical protein
MELSDKIIKEFEQVELTFTATLMTNFGMELDRDEVWDALNDALENINENNFLIGRTQLEITGENDE